MKTVSAIKQPNAGKEKLFHRNNHTIILKSVTEERKNFTDCRIVWLLVYLLKVFSPSTLVWQFYSQPLKMWVKGSSGTCSQRQRNKSWEQKVVLKFGRKALAPVYSGTNSKCGVQGRAWSHVLSKPSLFRRGILTYLSASQHPLTFRLQPCVRYSLNYSIVFGLKIFRQYSPGVLKEENKPVFHKKAIHSYSNLLSFWHVLYFICHL